MRVDILSKEYPPSIYGGAGVHVAELTRALRDRGDIDVRVHAFGGPRDEEGTTDHPDLPQLDGANAWHEFRFITLPGLRQEIGVCLTVTMIAALASFDIVYIATGGGPGHSTTVPGLEIYRLAFAHRQVGLASALAVVLMLLVVICILPIQWLTRAEKK